MANLSAGIAYIDQTYCVGCGACYPVCVYTAIEERKNGKYYVIETFCIGRDHCQGPCADECNVDAITFDYTDD